MSTKYINANLLKGFRQASTAWNWAGYNNKKIKVRNLCFLRANGNSKKA